MKLLSVMAAIRLDEDVDNVGNTLSLALLDPKASGSTNRSISVDPLASSNWEKVGVLSQSWLPLAFCFNF